MIIEKILNKLTPGEVRSLLIYYGQPADLHRFEEEQQIIFITSLLKNNTREQISKRVMTKFKVSKATAYRRISAALSQNPMNNETGLCFNFALNGAIKTRVKKDG